MMTFNHYHEWVALISKATGLSDPILHIHAGLAVLLIARVVTGRSFGTFVPFLFVVVAEGANEALDYFNQGLSVADSVSDVLNTLVWPFLLSCGVRLRAPEPKR